MNVADDVEGAGFLLAVVVEAVAGDGLDGVDFAHVAQVVDVTETLLLEVAQAAAQLLAVASDDVPAQVAAVGALGVALLGHGVGHVEHYCHGQHVVLAGQGHQGLAAFLLHVGGIDHGEQPAFQALGHQVVQQLKGVFAGRLVVFIVGHQAPAGIRRHDFRGLEQAPRKRGLARTRAANEEDKGEFGDFEGILGHWKGRSVKLPDYKIKHPTELAPQMAKYHTSAEENEILPNLLGLTDATAIGLAEFEGFLRANITLTESLTPATKFTLDYLLEAHRLALDHLYAFAGRYREVNISKGGFTFPAARFLPASMQQFEREWLLRPLPNDRENLLDLIAGIHGELLFIHPFREGNGRAARLLASLMLVQQGYARPNWAMIDSALFPRYVAAVQQCGLGNYAPMRSLLRQLCPG